jgi:hypothetical protein
MAFIFSLGYWLFIHIHRTGKTYALLKGQSLDAYLVGGISSTGNSVDGFGLGSPGRDRVLLFVREGCPHCAALLHELSLSVAKKDATRLTILFVRPSNIQIGATEFPQGAAVVTGDRLAKRLGIHVTPVALVVGPDDRIIDVFVGDDISVSARLVQYLHETLPSGLQVQEVQKAPCGECLVK